MEREALFHLWSVNPRLSEKPGCYRTSDGAEEEHGNKEQDNKPDAKAQEKRK
jgi:hypothetical protein